VTAVQLTKLVLQQVSTLFDKLTEDQLADLAEGRAYLEFRSEETVVKAAKPRKTATAPVFDVEGIAAEIRELSSSTEVKSYLDSKKFKKLELVAIAVALGPTVSAKGSVPQLVQNIVEGTVGFRERAAAIGGWGR
jgi:hypothetical protein